MAYNGVIVRMISTTEILEKCANQNDGQWLVFSFSFSFIHSFDSHSTSCSYFGRWTTSQMFKHT